MYYCCCRRKTHSYVYTGLRYLLHRGHASYVCNPVSHHARSKIITLSLQKYEFHEILHLTADASEVPGIRFSKCSKKKLPIRMKYEFRRDLRSHSRCVRGTRYISFKVLKKKLPVCVYIMPHDQTTRKNLCTPAVPTLAYQVLYRRKHGKIPHFFFTRRIGPLPVI